MENQEFSILELGSDKGNFLIRIFPTRINVLERKVVLATLTPPSGGGLEECVFCEKLLVRLMRRKGQNNVSESSLSSLVAFLLMEVFPSFFHNNIFL